jgi:N12 class adenine-specific DNA methylase
MTDEFNLSEKRHEIIASKEILMVDKEGIYDRIEFTGYLEKDVKEFIKRLKEEIYKDFPENYGSMFLKIDKLAGDKLIK